MQQADHWQQIAQRWAQVGPPLRPSPQDVVFASAVVGPAPRALILGVTPELYRLPWPEGTDLIALDHTEGRRAVPVSRIRSSAGIPFRLAAEENQTGYRPTPV